MLVQIQILRSSSNFFMSQTNEHVASAVASHSCTPGILSAMIIAYTLQFEKIIMRFLSIILIISFSLSVSAQKKTLYDSSKIEQRNFSTSSLNVYKNDTDFQYEKEPVEGQTLWDRFWDWVWNKYDDIMSTETGRDTMKAIYWLLGGAAI